jgi:hypothetical protein
MKRTSLFCAFVTLTAAAILPVWASTGEDSFAAMHAFLVSNQLPAFVTEIGKRQWVAPLIHSKWYVDRMTNMDVRAEEYPYREFGRLLAQRLSTNAAIVRARQTASVYDACVADLLTLGHWIGVKHGYGNLMLSWRASDIAAVALCKLITDLSFPTNKIEALMLLLDVPGYRWSFKGAALNEEAGMAMFNTNGADEMTDLVLNPVYRTWGIGASTAERVLRYGQKADPLMLRALPESARTNLQFFLDDVIDRTTPDTTEGCWDKKLHKRLGQGFSIGNKRSAYSLLLYRKRVGFFPTEPPPYTTPPGTTPCPNRYNPTDPEDRIYLAFQAYWDKSKVSYRKEPGIGDGTAASAFLGVLKGMLIDIDFLQHGYEWGASPPALNLANTNAVNSFKPN